MWHARPVLDSDLDTITAISAGVDVNSLLERINRDRDATAVVSAGQVVAWAAFDDGTRYAAVAPDHLGRGIGTWLLRWSAWRAKAHGLDRVTQEAADPATAAWLAAHDHARDGDRFVMAVD